MNTQSMLEAVFVTVAQLTEVIHGTVVVILIFIVVRSKNNSEN
jgi:hypothetical protein